mmetsp:Transcript_28861/g.47837  ORF Transcript_28861/g.47837 Transcript_28861/m.47837 type:complete len:555 (+) Transcript_28861:151-1815(+)|eukprot:CAMPEP_0119321852 /NCGR_PEP_ID=MMETSP1333-20130426/56610_1 /TAXON_ID=418940 /ORGANISM="Scyphosphaera apsteinii, Strain RCC1455" /LENGTH=554 /DNA_ID=CAMNT_0007328929 /DNA_START=147 /DNA_END=1811 /DNA_ORIENTATION=+
MAESRPRRNTVATPFGPMKSNARKALLHLVEAAAATSGTAGAAVSDCDSTPMISPPSALQGSSQTATGAKASAASLASLASPDNSSPSSQGSKTVAELRARPGLFIEAGTSVVAAARRMASANTDVALIICGGALAGIFTDTDVTRKLLAAGLDPNTTSVDKIMTVEPKCVPQEATAASALITMIEGRFRHLPVVSPADGFKVIGVLDVAKCLHDAVVRIDSVQLGGSVRLASLLPVPPPITTAGSHAQASGTIMAGETVQQAAKVIAKWRSGILVSSEGQPCVGIITPKDLLFRVVAAGLPASSTRVHAVMTPQPDTMVPSASVLDALRQLQGSGYRTVPVVTGKGEPYGVLDILGLIKGALFMPPEGRHRSDSASMSLADGSSLDGSEPFWAEERARSTNGQFWAEEQARSTSFGSKPESLADEGEIQLAEASAIQPANASVEQESEIQSADASAIRPSDAAAMPESRVEPRFARESPELHNMMSEMMAKIIAEHTRSFEASNRQLQEQHQQWCERLEVTQRRLLLIATAGTAFAAAACLLATITLLELRKA